jgi:hypothetical protein
VNKRRNHKYGKLLAKLAITTPWEGEDKTVIEFMCIAMIDPAISWFEIAELSKSQPSELDIPMGTKGQRGTRAKTHIFNKSIHTLTNRLQQLVH